MPTSSEAEEHLRVIRSLLEKATIYRALSSQAALAGGLLACAAGWLLAGRNDPFTLLLSIGTTHPANAELFGFMLKWGLVLVIAVATNFVFLYRDAQRRRETFVSPGMRMALRAMIPPLLCAAVFSSFGSKEGLPQAWMIFYGLALLSTAHFAPTSLSRLGWAFLLTGCVLLLVDARVMLGGVQHVTIPGPGEHRQPPAWTYADTMMASTFGAYHLIYAACTRKPKSVPAAAIPVNG